MITTNGYTAGRPAGKLRLSEVLEVVNEVRQLPALVYFLARRHHALRQWPRPATEHADFAHLKSDINNMFSFRTRPLLLLSFVVFVIFVMTNLSFTISHRQSIFFYCLSPKSRCFSKKKFNYYLFRYRY